MNIVTVSLTLWALALVAYLGLMVYRAQLTHNETDQLFLMEEDGPSSDHIELQEIIERDGRLEPVARFLGGLAVVCSVLMGCVWFVHILSRGHLIS
jgi:hypothetical protein